MNKVLIANRGEIALRIIRTARALGLKTVAVYSEADEQLPHVILADEAFCVGPAAAELSYLNQEKLLDVARSAGADCVHPGYGFLAENPDFAEAVAEAGMTFIGPSAAAMRLLGHKDQARALAQKCGVPVVPGFHDDDLKDETLIREAKKLGLPVLFKARAGGGGKGMRMVRSESELKEAIAGARREGKAFFSDDRLLIEKLIAPARHIEVQILADSLGNVRSVFERECSLQRRHQKIIEEAPAQGISRELLEQIYQAAEALAREAKLTNATTIEFILPVSSVSAGDPFYFLEANCRIQVEHPVTEAITGLDLIELQFFIARGGDLSTVSFPDSPCGHAIEARIYAELPGCDFLPTVGVIEHLSFPDAAGVRVDHALAEGLRVTTNYDPMLAKMIVHARDREHALAALRAALRDTRIVGVETNMRFLDELARDRSEASLPAHTTYVDENLAVLTACYDDQLTLQAACCAFFIARALRFTELNSDVYASAAESGARSNEPLEQLSLQSTATGRQHQIAGRVVAAPGGGRTTGAWEFEIDDERLSANVKPCSFAGELLLAIDRQGPAAIHFSLREPHIVAHTKLSLVVFQQHLTAEQFVARNEGRVEGDADPLAVTSPLPGTVIRINVSQGDAVRAGQTVCIIESMKMEHALTAPGESTVSEVLVQQGAPVEQGQLLVRLSE